MIGKRPRVDLVDDCAAPPIGITGMGHARILGATRYATAGPWPALALLGYGWGAGCTRLLDYPREQCVELFAFRGGESDQDCVIEPLSD
jgi:hypothetical protein